ncbi:aspartyl-tRNA synthetase [Spirochaeta thermophila DSM 6578]|uniref:Aspartate--tRNA(Asp/Asn) ligase n=1 Tax=Winmispira thermophila (strain ATCC 700085 / DSM 6578 / Z-1203) TaxID=869211 RepID=G0GG42_WINT7|nr:aspartate--tRNA(Asn) ligase [Spirochaeta thermophila]AEJ62518.1 aspartyl-tRNA synthetase [Spirochaeta thermophila DSM 6578]
MRVLAARIASHTGKDVVVKGWVHRIRELGGISFIILRDRSGEVQLVLEGSADLTLESVISVKGRVEANEKAPGGAEIHVGEIEVLARAEPDLPIPINQDPSQLSLDALLDHRMLSLRIPKIRTIFTLQAGLVQYFADYLRSQGFSEIKTSKLIATGTEGGTGLFEVNYFDRKVYLAQSPQFYKQAMVASGMERVFEIGMAYRAEKHDTPRHLNEYVSLDVEMAFIETEHDLMDLEEGILAYMFEKVKSEHEEVLRLWDATVPDPERVKDIPRISYDEGKKIASERAGRKIFEINPEAERLLCEWAHEKAGIEAVFVYGFPRRARPFYTYPEGRSSTRSFDLLFRGLEITTGGRRIHEYSMLKETLPLFGLTEEGLGGYVEIFKYGCPPHGGFAIGLERLTQKILGLQNVREASLFPRDRRRVSP